jgi:hypothetical protein
MVYDQNYFNCSTLVSVIQTSTNCSTLLKRSFSEIPTRFLTPYREFEASTECSAGSKDHFVVVRGGGGGGVPSLVQFDGRPLMALIFSISIAQSRNIATQQSRNRTITQPCNTTITQPCNTTIMQPYNATITQHCDTTITQPCNTTKMQPCNTTIMQPCNATITQPCNATITQPCNATITQPCKNQNCNVVVDLLDLDIDSRLNYRKTFQSCLF